MVSLALGIMLISIDMSNVNWFWKPTEHSLHLLKLNLKLIMLDLSMFNMSLKNLCRVINDPRKCLDPLSARYVIGPLNLWSLVNYLELFTLDDTALGSPERLKIKLLKIHDSCYNLAQVLPN